MAVATPRSVGQPTYDRSDVTMTPSVQGEGAEFGSVRVKKAMPEAGPMPPWGYVN